MDKDAVWSMSPDVRATYSEDGAVLLDIRKGLCSSLNVAAARVWTTIESSPNGIAFQGLVDAVHTHFNVSRQELEADIAEHLEKLEKMGLVRRNGRTPSLTGFSGET